MIRDGKNYQYYCKIDEYLNFSNQKGMPDNDKKLALANYYKGVIRLNECYFDEIS